MAIFSGISALVGGLLGGTFLSGGLGTLLLNTAVGVGLNLAATALAGKDQPKETRFSLESSVQIGGDIPRSFIIGRAATAGSLVYVNTWGEIGKTPNAYLTQVFALSDMPVRDLVEMYVDGAKVTIGDPVGHPAGRPVEQYFRDVDGTSRAHLWVRFYDGTQADADDFLTTLVSSPVRPWGENCIGKGIAYAIVTARINEELFTGIPTFKFVVDGMKLYDPSKDSTQPGGDGPQRWSNRSTWGGDGDDLPAVQLYNLLRGISFEGQWLYGLQNLPAARLPVSSWIAQIEKCRDGVNGPNGTEPRFRAGGEIPVDAPFADAVQALLTACNGRLIEAGGAYDLTVGDAGTADFAFDDDDIISTEPQSFTPFFGLADTINGIAGSYPSPDDGWNVKASPSRYSTEFEAEDGGRRLTAEIEFSMVPYRGQVQRLMKAALREARRARRHTITLPPQFWTVQPGNRVRWSSSRNGYDTKLFRVDGVLDRWNLDVTVDLTEIDPEDYDWNQDVDYRTEVDGDLGKYEPEPQPVVDWNAIPYVLEDNSARPRKPAILLSWDGDVDDVRGVSFEVRLAITQTVVYRGRTDQVDAGAIIISQNLGSDIAYQARGKYLPTGRNRRTLWSGWLDVTTPLVRLSDDDVYLPGMLEDIKDFDREATRWIRQGTRALIAEANKFARLTIDQDTGNYKDRQETRTLVKSSTAKMRAEYRNEILVATGPGSAIAQQITALTAGLATKANVSVVDGLSARVTTTENGIVAIGGALTDINTVLASKASASALTALTTRVSSAEGKISSQSQSLTQINASLATKASVSAVTLLTGRVDDNEGEISSVANAVTSLSAAQNGNDVATANFRMRVLGGPEGFAARIALEARAGGAGAWRSAAIFFDVPKNPNNPSRILMRAEQVVIVNSTDGGGIGAGYKYPFVFQGQTLRLRDVVLVNADIANLDVQWAKIKNVRITGNLIVDGAIITNKLSKRSVTTFGRASSGSMKAYSSNNWVTVDSVTINNDSAVPVMCDFDWDAQAITPGGGSSGSITIEVRLVRVQGNGLVQVNAENYRASRTNNSAGTTSAGGQAMFMDFDTGWAGGNRTYRLQVRVSKSGGAGSSYAAKARCAVKLLGWMR